MDELEMAALLLDGELEISLHGEITDALAQDDLWLVGAKYENEGAFLHAMVVYAKLHQTCRLRNSKAGCYWSLWHLNVLVMQSCGPPEDLEPCLLDNTFDFLLHHKDLWLAGDTTNKANCWAMFYIGSAANFSTMDVCVATSWLWRSLMCAEEETALREQAYAVLTDAYLRSGDYSLAATCSRHLLESPQIDIEDRFDMLVKLFASTAMMDDFEGADKCVEEMTGLAIHSENYKRAAILKMQATLSYLVNHYADCERLNRQAVQIFAILPIAMHESYLEYLKTRQEEVFPPHRIVQLVEFNLMAWKEIVECHHRLGKNVKLVRQEQWAIVSRYAAEDILEATCGKRVKTYTLYVQARLHLDALELDNAEAVAADYLKLASEANSASDYVDGLTILVDVGMERDLNNEHVQKVIESFLLEAERLMQPKKRNHRVVLSQLGGLYFRTRQWSKVVEVLEQYSPEFMTLDERFGSSRSRRIEYTDTTEEVFHCMQVALLELDKPQPKKALVWAERGRARDMIYSLSSQQEGPSSTFDLDYETAWEELRTISKSVEDTVFLVYTIQWLGKFWEDEYNLVSYLLYKNDQEPRWRRHEAARPIETYIFGIVCLLSDLKGKDKTVSEYFEYDSFKAEHPEHPALDSRLGLLQNFLHELYKILLEPWWDELDDIAPKRLVIVPTKVLKCMNMDIDRTNAETISQLLALVPFAGLITKAGEKDEPDEYVIEKYAISVSPSLRVFKRCQERHKQLNRTGINKVLVVGDPDKSLPSAAEEAELVVQSFGSAVNVVYLGNRTNNQPAIEATPKRLLEEMQGSDWIHIASHAAIDEELPQGGIILSNDKSLRAEEQVLTPKQIEDANVLLSAKGVILSACSTALGVQKSEGILGLCRSLHLRGAPAIIASIWDVDSGTTKELMRRFYEEMFQNGATEASEALHLAMKSMAKEMDMFGEEPMYKVYHWAPFVISGC